MVAGMTTSQGYDTSIDFKGKIIAFDVSHGGYHATLEVLTPLINNLTDAGNEVLLINETWELPDEVDMLFLTQSDDPFNVTETADIVAWFALGDKLLWVSGDSDYGGYYDPSNINDVLDALGSIARIDGTSIEDAVYNDGASYRAAATEFGVGDTLYDEVATAVTAGMEAGLILHGPCAIVAFDGTYYKDMRYGQSVFPERVMTLMTYSVNATAIDSDTSLGGLDLYANTTEGASGVTTGLYPAIVYENMTTQDSHIILSGEAVYTAYKYMYDQGTENGVYNGGLTYGQMFVNNVLNYFFPKDASLGFVAIPLALIGVVYVISRRKK